MSIVWRTTLVQMQTVLQAGMLPISESTIGYALVNELTVAGELYDSVGDDGQSNPSALSVTVNGYVAQAQPVFDEVDRFSRYIFMQNLSFISPQMGVDFGILTTDQAANWLLYLRATALYDAQLAAWQAGGEVGDPPTLNIPQGAAIPSLNPPDALVFDRTGGNFATLTLRYNDSIILAGSRGQTDILNTAYLAWSTGVWWDIAKNPQVSALFTAPPTNPDPVSEYASAEAIAGVNNAIDDCNAWLGATSLA